MSKLQQQDSVKKPGKNKPLVAGVYDSTTVVY